MNLFNNPEDAVYDSTGTNSERMVRYMALAQAAGMTTKLVFVVVELETSLARNSRRDRVVPEDVIRMKADDIATSFSICSEHAQTVQVIENEWEKQF
jgi:predicted kinase